MKLETALLVEADDPVARLEAGLCFGGRRSGIRDGLLGIARLDHFQSQSRRDADHPPPRGDAGRQLNLEGGPVGMNARHLDRAGGEGDRSLNVLERRRRASADARDAVAGLQPRFPCRKTGLQRADDRRGHLDPVAERDRVKQHGRDDVHAHAGGNDRHPLADALGRIGPRIPGDLLARQLAGIHVVLAQHLDVAAERNGRERVFRLAVFAAPEDRAETDAEALDEDVAPLGDGKMPQLVEENDQPDADQHGQDASRLADVRTEKLNAARSRPESKVARTFTDRLSRRGPPAGPSVHLQQVRQSGRRIEMMGFQDRAAKPRDVGKPQLPGQKPLDGDLVGRVQNRAARPPRRATS